MSRFFYVCLLILSPLFSFGLEEVEVRPLSQRSSMRQIESRENFSSVEELRQKRRVGVGAIAMGPLGLGGALVELNFNPRQSALIGTGGGPRYNAFLAGWKRSFPGETFSPYLGLGYSHWYSFGSPRSIEKTNPAFISSRWLTEEDKEAGRFEKSVIVASGGFQYYQLRGAYTGLSFLAEVSVLSALSSPNPIPTGGLGLLYYF